MLDGWKAGITFLRLQEMDLVSMQFCRTDGSDVTCGPGSHVSGHWQARRTARGDNLLNATSPRVAPMRVTEPQRQLLHILMLDDEPDGDCWVLFDPPFNPLTVQACERKGWIEVSEHGCRLTNAGRAVLSVAA